MTFFLYRHDRPVWYCVFGWRSQNQINVPHNRLYFAFAFAGLILTCCLGFFATGTFHRSEWMVPVTFGLCAIYAALGVLSGTFVDLAGRAKVGYFIFQCLLLTAMLWLSPIRGMFAIIVLPVVSQAILGLNRRGALLVGLYLYALTISIWSIPFGWTGARRASLNYAVPFAITAIFSMISRRALAERDRLEKLRQKLESANEQLRAHAVQSEEFATTRERNRVAREIHDGLGHYLAVVKTQLDVATALLPAHPDKARESIEKAAHLAAEALDDVRRSVGSLRIDAPRPPLPEALRILVRETDLPVVLNVEGPVCPLPPEIEHALFRAVQEGLTNIRKHAAASSAEVVLDFRQAGRVTISVVDDGRGINGAAPVGGYGLIGVRERVEVLGGSVASGNRPAGGFALTIEVPA